MYLRFDLKIRDDRSSARELEKFTENLSVLRYIPRFVYPSSGSRARSRRYREIVNFYEPKATKVSMDHNI